MQYESLFTEVSKGDQIGVCRWNEAGTTIKSALPELGNLTDDKEEWRAIVVRYLDDHNMAAFPADPDNPYDFELNKVYDGLKEESPIPLIRLTHMLGGVPAVEVKYEAEVIKEDHKPPRTVYNPVYNKELEAVHKKLTDKYHYDGKLPSSIMILTVRRRWLEEVGVDKEWKLHKESDSSEFWKRNSFPSICRFMVYDFTNQGPVQRNADDFGFWYTVMLLANNRWDPGTIQAYRLYNIKPRMDKDGLTEVFQHLTNQLRDVKGFVERSIKRDIEDQISEEEGLPMYEIDVPVNLDTSDLREYYVSAYFGLLSRGEQEELAYWEKRQKDTENAYIKAVRSAERSLDQSAERSREYFYLGDENVDVLSKYQMEDMELETNALYQSIIAQQGDLPNEKSVYGDDQKNASEKVRNKLIGRVTTSPAVLTLVSFGVLMLAGTLPQIIACIKKNGEGIEYVLYVLGGWVLLSIIAAWIVLMVQWGDLKKLIKKYNNALRRATGKLTNSGRLYSQYISDIASHGRGKAYMEISEAKVGANSMYHKSKYAHLRAINTLLGRIRMWSKAYSLDIDFTSYREEKSMDLDYSVAPAANSMYFFETEDNYQIPINNSGICISSPYRFASRLEVTREELYDDH